MEITEMCDLVKKCSNLTFGEITKNLGYVKVIWNGICIYDDEFGDESPEHFRDIQEKYNNKIVYEMNIKIVQFHHCILNIKRRRIVSNINMKGTKMKIVNVPKFMEERMTEKYEINIDTAKGTTLIRCGLGTVELPFALCNDIIKCLDTETLAKLISDIYLAGFEDGYDSAEFDNEDEILRARLGDFY